MSGTSFENALLLGANFTAINIAGVNLSGADLTGANTTYVVGASSVTSSSGITCPDGGGTSGSYICTGWGA
jgi:hypothetical protein